MEHNKPFKLDELVTFTIQGHKVRWCKVTAIKQDEYGHKYDIQVDNIKLYDVNGDLLESISKEPTDNAINQPM